jgi:hypothetical protein
LRKSKAYNRKARKGLRKAHKVPTAIGMRKVGKDKALTLNSLRPLRLKRLFQQPHLRVQIKMYEKG